MSVSGPISSRNEVAVEVEFVGATPAAAAAAVLSLESREELHLVETLAVGGPFDESRRRAELSPEPLCSCWLLGASVVVGPFVVVVVVVSSGSSSTTSCPPAQSALEF